MINKTSLKFIIGALFIIGFGVVAWFVSVSVSPEARQEREAREYFENLKEQYENDTYGGDTPEETLALFIEALEKGDVELASKYFVIDEQEEWRKNLANIQDAELLDEMVRDLQRPKEKQALIEGNTDRFNYFIYNDDEILSVVIDITKGPNNKWKILDL